MGEGPYRRRVTFNKEVSLGGIVKERRNTGEQQGPRADFMGPHPLFPGSRGSKALFLSPQGMPGTPSLPVTL